MEIDTARRIQLAHLGDGTAALQWAPARLEGDAAGDDVLGRGGCTPVVFFREDLAGRDDGHEFLRAADLVLQAFPYLGEGQLGGVAGAVDGGRVAEVDYDHGGRVRVVSWDGMELCGVLIVMGGSSKER